MKSTLRRHRANGALPATSCTKRGQSDKKSLRSPEPIVMQVTREVESYFRVIPRDMTADDNRVYHLHINSDLLEYLSTREFGECQIQDPASLRFAEPIAPRGLPGTSIAGIHVLRHLMPRRDGESSVMFFSTTGRTASHVRRNL